MSSEALKKIESLNLSDPVARQTLRAMIQAKAAASFPGALKRIIEIVDSESETRALAAARLLAEIGGLLTHKQEVEVKVTFEELLSRPGDGDLSALFNIQTPVIDGEIEDE